MIVFAASITSPETYERCAAPGIRRAAEPDSQVRPYQAAGSIFRSYNLILDEAAEIADLEALVLVHQDAEIADSDFCPKLRRALEQPDVGVVGCVGAVGVRSIAWWEGSVTWGSFTHRYEEMGGGEIAALSWNVDRPPTYARTGEVDTVDGFVLGLSPWTVRNIRFDESLGQLHGYAIAARLEQISKGAIQLNMGTLYPALMRLEQRGLVRGQWGVTDTNRKARFYGLTATGRRELAHEKQDWDRLTGIMAALIRGDA